MRALFYCRIRRTKVMVHIARALRESGKLEAAFAFVAYRDQWRGYIRQQKEVEFEKIAGTREIFDRLGRTALNRAVIDRLEADYGSLGITLPNLISTERYLVRHTHHIPYNHPAYTDDDILRYVQCSFEYIEELFDTLRLDAVVDFAPVNIVRCAMDLVAKKRGVPFLYVGGAMLEDRYVICTRMRDEYRSTREAYARLRDIGVACPDGSRYLSAFRKRDAGSVYSHHAMALLNEAARPRRIRRMLQSLRRTRYHLRKVVMEPPLRVRALYDHTARYNFQLFKNQPSIKMYRWMLAAWRRFQMRVRSPFDNGPLPPKYVLLTLHFQPEASTATFAPFFVDQRHVIDGITRALPLGWSLVVKPHPLMVKGGREPVSFYRWIQSIPNAHLVSPDHSTRRLLDGAVAVVSITGTSGLEGALLGKKVVALSDIPIWTMIRGVTVCTDFTRLHDIFTKVPAYQCDDHDLAAYLQAVHDTSFPLKRNYIWFGPYDWEHQEYREAVMTLARKMAEAYDEERAATQRAGAAPAQTVTGLRD